MNREILFRGKRTDNGEWVEGAFLNDRDGAFYICPAVSDITYGDNGNRRRIGCWHKVDPATVGQFVGLCDKNGAKIFEGDLVSFKRDNALGYTTSRVGEVKYYTELPIFYIMATTGDAWDWCECNDINVIGNSNDDPSLLQG